MRKIIQTFIFPALCSILLFSACSVKLSAGGSTESVIQNTETDETVELSTDSQEQSDTVPLTIITVEESIEEVEEQLLSDEEIELIALVTMAEAEGECEEGKRLVIDTVINRVDSIYFPDTVYEVIYQPSQFSSMWNGRVDRCEVRDDICELVREELENRTNYEVIFFTAGGYSNYGVPLFQVGNHYFSSYD